MVGWGWTSRGYIVAGAICLLAVDQLSDATSAGVEREHARPDESQLAHYRGLAGGLELQSAVPEGEGPGGIVNLVWERWGSGPPPGSKLFWSEVLQ